MKSTILKTIFISFYISGLGAFQDFHQERNYLPTCLADLLKDITTGLYTKCLTIIDEINFNTSYLSKSIDNSLEVTSIIFCKPTQCEDLLEKLRNKNLIHRSLLYIFYWGKQEASKIFLKQLHEAMRVAVITNPRTGVFRLYYNQAHPSKEQSMPLVNWWVGRLFVAPALPSAEQVFTDFQGRTFRVPVLHAPPWHFVKLHDNMTIEVTGGRDHQLLFLLAQKLNFKFEYFDPPDHSQGSGVTSNGSFKGVLGMIYRRESDFFLGDVTMSWERQRGLEYSFMTLADSGAFVTHAPRRLSEALALLRPFRWEVWPAVLVTVVAAGPALWAAAAGSALWRPLRSPPPPPLARCIWFTTSIFLRQSVRAPSHGVRARAVSLLLSLAATYVLGDVYSATLTSLLARPAREPPLSSLHALEKAMLQRGYRLLVERHSSSLAILQNGTGVYGRLWKLMQQQPGYAVRSAEVGVRRVLAARVPCAFLAGRETLFFDTRRFGARNFQLSEKLFTRYSAIALQLGCPYLHNFNKVLMHLFEAGILTKITSEEYEKLGKSGAEGGLEGGAESGMTGAAPEEERLEPVTMRMLQGAFYLLIFGCSVSGVVLIMEIKMKKRSVKRHQLILYKAPVCLYTRMRIKRKVEKLFFDAHRDCRNKLSLSQPSLDFIE